MSIHMQMYIRHGTQLSKQEIDQINIAKNREWKIPPLQKNEQESTLFFLLKDESNTIVAQGEVIEINGIIFNNESFNILGVGGIIANEKGQGYGRELMTAIKEFIAKHKKTGIGFTNKPEFYQKCGFSIDIISKKQFVHLKDGKRITNKENEVILYLAGQDRLMEKIVALPSEDVVLPITPNW